MLRLLLTNDDGIHAPGLWSLFQELKDDFSVDIVAPETEMSAIGHAISLTAPLRVQTVQKEGGFSGYSVSGTPADCVKIAVQELLPHPPDMILSGINLGANVGVDVRYSGTVSAAVEGAFLGIKSAAISLNTKQNPDFRFAARFSRAIIDYIVQHGLRPMTALNVNIPAVPEEQIQGIQVSRQGAGRFKERYERRSDPRGKVYYWLVGDIPAEDGVPDTDVGALRENKITITPVSYDLTCREEVERLRACPLPEFKRRPMTDQE